MTLKLEQKSKMNIGGKRNFILEETEFFLFYFGGKIILSFGGK